jgi:hypothetical protein
MAFLTACDVDRVTACACAAATVAVVNAALDVWAQSPRANPAPAKTALTSGLQMVVTAFSSVVHGSDENTNGAPAPLAVLVAPDDPLRAEFLAAVARGAMVSERH